MSFVGSLFFLASLISGILVPVYFGRGLAEGNPTRMLMALVFAVVAAVFVKLYNMTDRQRGTEQ